MTISKTLIATRFALLLTAAQGIGCFNYRVDVSNAPKHSGLLNKCFVTQRRLMVYEWIKNGKGIHISPGNTGDSTRTLGWVETGSKIWVRKIERDHIAYYGNLLEPIVEVELNGSKMLVGAFYLFNEQPEALLPDQTCIKPCI